MAPDTKRGAFPRPTVSTGYSATVEVLHRTSKWGEVRRLACPLRRFPFAAPPNCGGKVVAPATKGGNAGVVHEVYASLFFSSNFLFPLEGKCHVVAKGCTGLSRDMTLYHFPDRQSAAPLSGADTTLGTEGRRPDGCHMPLCAAGAGPFGNTGKHRLSPDPDPGRALLKFLNTYSKI